MIRAAVSALLLLLAAPPAHAGTPNAACGLIANLASETDLTDIAVAFGPVTEHFTREQTDGCTVTGGFPTLSFTGPSPDEAVRAGLQARGWAQDLTRAADGPNGSVLGLTRDGVLCVVTARWEGHDDTVPGDWGRGPYGFEAACMPDPGPVRYE